MKKTLLFAFAALASYGVQAQCSEVFISEYVEGSGNDKGVELYNPTGTAINLDGYSLDRYSNGATTAAGGVLDLSGNTIGAYSTLVIVNGQTTVQNGGTSPAVSPAMQALADVLDGAYPAPTYFNGDDALVLTKSNGTVIVDIFGKIGEDPGSAWTDDASANYTDANGGTWWTRDQTLIRKSTVTQGETNAAISGFNVTLEWDSLPNNTWTQLGQHVCDCAVGVEEVENNAYTNVFPNPTTGQIVVSANGTLNSIQVLDITGKVIHDETLAGNVRRSTLDLTGKPEGIYLVRAVYETGATTTARVVLQ